MKTQSRITVSAIVPVYNEETTVSRVVEKVLSIGKFHEVICVNDGSTDHSQEELEKLVEKIKLISFIKNQGKGHALATGIESAQGDLVAFIDADLTKQALLNLFINAQQAMPNGGELMIRTSKADNNVRIDITDTGLGIDLEKLTNPQAIFEAYHSSKKGGTGLGLAMTKRIIEQHNGSISILSEKGKGTSFTILLPALKQDSENA